MSVCNLFILGNTQRFSWQNITSGLVQWDLVFRLLHLLICSSRLYSIIKKNLAEWIFYVKLEQDISMYIDSCS